MLFTKKELSLFKSDYFKILKIYENYIEIQSLNTEHCWIIQKTQSKPMVVLHHKHLLQDKYYHKHYYGRTTKDAYKQIISHDAYVLSISR
jgi:hypothetical protein